MRQNVYLNLTIYDIKPNVEIDVDTLQEISTSRLYVLRSIANEKRHKKSLLNENYNLIDELKKHNLLYNKQLDIISHLMCRFVFAESSEYTQWFIKQEVSLFETKYLLSNNIQKSEVKSKLLIKQYPIYFEADVIKHDLNGRNPIPYFQFDSTTSQHHKLVEKYFPFYVVPFAELLHTKLISKRMVYVRNGYCFVPNFLFIILVCDIYQKYLKQKLKNAKQALSMMRNDPNMFFQLKKIMYLIQGLNKIPYFIENNQTSEITHYNIDKYLHLFPLCMRYTIESLKKNGHLKNNSRFQLTLFLKGIGLSLDESIIFFKKLFTKTSNFDSNYSYFIRHQYGKEGNFNNYKPLCCTTIIENKQKNNDDMDHHGCPFKVWDQKKLNTFIKNYFNIKNFQNSNMSYQLQCKKLFTILNQNILNTCSIDIEDINFDWNHPNRYFDIGRDLYRGNPIKHDNKRMTIEYL